MPRELRPAFSALWRLDLAFADVVATSTDAHLGAIRMAWWRERLEELDQGKVPAEPRLQAVAYDLLSRGVTGKELSNLEEAWLPLLHSVPWSEVQMEALVYRGRILFGIGARLLGGQAAEAEPAGALWSLVDGAEHCGDPDSRTLLRRKAEKALGRIVGVTPRHLRPLTILAALAVASLAHEGSGIARLKAAVLHRALGRFPRS